MHTLPLTQTHTQTWGVIIIFLTLGVLTLQFATSFSQNVLTKYLHHACKGDGEQLYGYQHWKKNLFYLNTQNFKTHIQGLKSDWKIIGSKRRELLHFILSAIIPRVTSLERYSLLKQRSRDELPLVCRRHTDGSVSISSLMTRQWFSITPYWVSFFF